MKSPSAVRYLAPAAVNSCYGKWELSIARDHAKPPTTYSPDFTSQARPPLLQCLSDGRPTGLTYQLIVPVATTAHICQLLRTGLMFYKSFHGRGRASSDTSDTQLALQIVAGRLLSTRQQSALAQATRASVSLWADQELMDVQKASIEDVFKKYTRLSRERKCFVIDVRPYKDWKRRHLLLSYCIRLSANGKALVDYSKNRYDQKWSQVCMYKA